MTVKMELTDEGKEWMVKQYPPGFVWDYDPQKPFNLVHATAKTFGITQDGIPIDVPHEYCRKSDKTGEET